MSFLESPCSGDYTGDQFFLMLMMTYRKFQQNNFTDIHGSIIPATGVKHMELHGLCKKEKVFTDLPSLIP
ncbi:hypothetical protein AV530_013880 [Patagioenas fasciata monilis]|uniref:Uncharacterized protein n=1 Tax=Patagioenas fasciata monilis TaxID=372326 RepID=A0A1V4KMT0_PATFA|nr:hypothetical protein AV530_013880 [Patagioenas fasciata monilis]